MSNHADVYGADGCFYDAFGDPMLTPMVVGAGWALVQEI